MMHFEYIALILYGVCVTGQRTTVDYGTCSDKDGIEDIRQGQQNIQRQLDDIKVDLQNINCGSPQPGEHEETAAGSCLDVLQKRLVKPSNGRYWIRLNATYAIPLYCDMATDGGGWTLIWTYAFTNFASFASYDNALTPRPSWRNAESGHTPLSTTPPYDQDTLGALNFTYWSQLGRQFLIKSDINQWLSCSPSPGTMLDYISGNMDCSIVRVVTPDCQDIVPTTLSWLSGNGGPLLNSPNGRHYYQFDTSTTRYYPFHDPCGQTSINNHLRNASQPLGNIFVR